MRYVMLGLLLGSALLAGCAAEAPALATPATQLAPAAAPSPTVPAATAPPAGPAPAATAGGNTMSPEPAAAAASREALARRLNLAPADLKLLESTAVDWPDACLGAAEPGEMCAQMITPGFRLTFDTSLGPYLVRTDRPGRVFRFSALPSAAGVPGSPAPPQPTGQAGAAPPPAVAAAQATLVAQLGAGAGEAQLVSFEPVEWRDSCLGAAAPREMCLQVITPGYRFIFSTPKGTYEVHTDRTGAAARVLPAGQ